MRASAALANLGAVEGRRHRLHGGSTGQPPASWCVTTAGGMKRAGSRRALGRAINRLLRVKGKNALQRGNFVKGKMKLGDENSFVENQ